jgi:hypothetical protein
MSDDTDAAVAVPEKTAAEEWFTVESEPAD